jgi:hypothetical protein
MRGEKSRLGNEAVDVALYQIKDRSMGGEEVDIDEERIFEVEVPTSVAKPAGSGNRFLTRHEPGIQPEHDCIG